MKHQKKLLLIFVLVCAFLTQLANPAPARADDEQPPVQPTDTVTEPPLQPDDGTTPEVINDPAPADSPAAESALALDSTAVEIPANTVIIAINEDNQVVPLATSEAADIIAIGDPVWCPTGNEPGDGGCSQSYLSLYSLVNDLSTTGTLINQATGLAFTPSGPGVIWIKEGTDTSSNPINLDDGMNATLVALGGESLTLQGGWDGILDSNGTLITGSPSIFSVPIRVTWTNVVTVNDINITNLTDTGLTIGTSGDINLSNINSSGNNGYGAVLENCQSGGVGCVASGNINVTGTNYFDNNAAGGLLANSGGDASFSDITVNDNTGNGLRVGSEGTIALDNVSAIDNTSHGLYINSGGGITLNDVNTSYNLDWGAILYATGNVTGGSNTFGVNGETGLYVDTSGAVTLSDLHTNGNGGWGAVLYATDVTLNGSNVFISNGDDGLYVDASGDITLNDVYANGNVSGSGARLYATGNVTLSGTNEFSSNYGGDGLYIDASGDITLNDVDASDNFNDGAELHATGNVTLSGANTFINNGDDGWSDDGLYVNSGGAITLNDVYASGNLSYGAELYATGNVTLSGANTFNDNWEDGLYIESNDGNITLGDITAEWNSWNGVTLVSTGNNHANIAAASIQYNGWSDVDASWFCGNSVSLFGSYGFYSPQDCFGEEEDAKPVVADSPREQVVNTNTGLEIAFDIDCTIKDMYSIKLPNRDKIKIVCPADGHAVIKRLDNTMLPADLPAGYTYISAFSLEISLPLVGYISSIKGGYVTVAFSLPIVKPGISYAILYWDLGQWQEVQTFMIDASGKPRVFELDPNRNVVSGMNFVTNDNLPQMEASLNFPGVFVLAEY